MIFEWEQQLNGELSPSQYIMAMSHSLLLYTYTATKIIARNQQNKGARTPVRTVSVVPSAATPLHASHHSSQLHNASCPERHENARARSRPSLLRYGRHSLEGSMRTLFAHDRTPIHTNFQSTFQKGQITDGKIWDYRPQLPNELTDPHFSSLGLIRMTMAVRQMQ